MTASPDMEGLTFQDVERAHESLYYAARRYCTITERFFLQQASPAVARDGIVTPEFVSIGNAASDLAEAGQRYSEAYDRWDSQLPPEAGA